MSVRGTKLRIVRIWLAAKFVVDEKIDSKDNHEYADWFTFRSNSDRSSEVDEIGVP